MRSMRSSVPTFVLNMTVPPAALMEVRSGAVLEIDQSR
jgi:hypothetical protein